MTLKSRLLMRRGEPQPVDGLAPVSPRSRCDTADRKFHRDHQNAKRADEEKADLI